MVKVEAEVAVLRPRAMARSWLMRLRVAWGLGLGIRSDNYSFSFMGGMVE
jgi:hypothetical protein